MRERLAGLQVEGGQILKAVYHRDRPQGSDIENVLLYNIGGAALNRALGRGVVCEQAPLRLEVTGPAPALRVEDLKKICDGVVSALGAQSSDRDLTEVGHRIGSRLDLDGQAVRSALTDPTRAPLGVKARLAWLRADSVQGPADDRCMAFEMTFTSGDRWRLSGSAHEVTGRRS